MFFRRRASSSRAKAWLELAEKLELTDAADREPLLRELLNVGESVQPIYSLTFNQQDSVLLFDYHDVPAGSVAQTVSAALITVPYALADVSLRASKKLDKVLESLGASATGGQLVQVANDQNFNDQVTVYARDAVSATRLLRAPLRRCLLRALCDRDTKPTFLLGERHLLLSNRAPQDKPTPMNVVEAMLIDILSLYAALRAGSREAQLSPP